MRRDPGCQQSNNDIGRNKLLFHERRKHERKKVKDWTVFCVNGKWSSHGKVVDVSEGGMSVDMEHVPEMKQPVILYIQKGKKELTREAVPVWYIKHVPPATGAMVGLQYL